MNAVDYTFVFVNLLIGVGFSILIANGAIKLAKRFNLIDIPGSMPHKLHQNPTPLAGGIILIAGFIFFVFALGLYKSIEIVRIIVPLMIIFGFGIWDDKKHIRARYKFLGQIIACGVLLSSGVSIQVLESFPSFTSHYYWLAFGLDRLLTVLWLVGVTNAFNLVDSMDGLAIGLANLAFAFFMLASIDSQQVVLIQIFSILLGIGIGISLNNASPARLFLGDGGAQSLGFLLAVLGIYYTPLEKNPAATWFVPIMLVAVPIFDTSLVFFSRLKQGKSFYIASHDHTYHRLTSLGINSGRAVMIIHISALMVNCLGFIAVALDWAYSNLIFGVTLFIALVAFIYLEKVQTNHQVLNSQADE